MHIPSSLAFQLYGCVLAAVEENTSKEELLMQEIIASGKVIPLFHLIFQKKFDQSPLLLVWYKKSIFLTVLP